MTRKGSTLLVLALLAGCGRSDQDAGGLTADEQQRLENIAARLDEDNAAVRERLEADDNALMVTDTNQAAAE